VILKLLVDKTFNTKKEGFPLANKYVGLFQDMSIDSTKSKSFVVFDLCRRLGLAAILAFLYEDFGLYQILAVLGLQWYYTY